LPISRSTVDRSIEDLISIDFAAQEGSVYKSTTTGRLALREYDQFKSRTDSLTGASTLLNNLPEEVELDPVILDGARITLAESHAPEQALEPSSEILKDATVLKGLAPVVLNTYLFNIGEQLERDCLGGEIVVEPDVLSSLQRTSNDIAEPIFNDDSLSLYLSETQLPYALWIMETPNGDQVGVTVYNSTGVAGVLVNDSDSAVQWAESQYQSYRDQAELLSKSELLTS